MKFHMKNLNWKHGNLYERVESWKVKLKNVQMQVDKDPHNVALKTEEARTLKEYMIAMQDEEKFLYQNAKITWMSDGDRNSKFFHEVIKGRIHRNRIDMVCNEKGERFDGKSVADQFVSHFQNFLGKAMQVNPFVPNSLNLKKVSMEDATSMVKPVTNEEIKCALCSAVKEFFLKGKMLREINATLITLIPKLSTPMKVSDYRPIACCNMLYKIISKMLTNRIKSALCKIVSPCQSAFIPGRQITDNILITQELLRGYNWKNGPKRVAMKIDIQKAYDTVNWDFLEEVLKEFNFPKEMVHWVMVCVRTATFSICVNGEVKKKINEESGFKYHWGCKELEIFHLCFANDLLVVCHGDVKSVKRRAQYFFGNVDDRTKAEILDILPFNIGKLPVSYLGKNRLLSYAGRLQLVASVLASMQVYWASVFILPKTVVKDIDRLLKGFLWCQGNLTKGKAKVAWKLVCRPKNEGGLGIKHLGEWNEVLMAKHLWNLACNKESLWVKWINVIRLKGRSIWEVDCNPNTSCGWKQILSLRNKMRTHVRYEIGNGESTYFWHDNWWEGGILSNSIPPETLPEANCNAKVSEMITNGEWNWPNTWNANYPWLDNIPVPNLMNHEDIAVWRNMEGNKVVFSVSKMCKDWMNNAILKRLNTQDRLTKWYPGKIMTCPLCEECPDSHEHLFFKCAYSATIWSDLKEKIKMGDISNEWDDVMDKIIRMACNNSIRSIVRRLVFAASIYFIWNERNKRLFGNQKRSSKDILLSIINHIRMKLTSLKVKASPNIQAVSSEWQITMNNDNSKEVLMDEWKE
ncbi:RNA-directed DNA polymerase, eukaryota, reverse transcriptase zinc-binding domain protein [Tanacetum coccineum]